MLLFHKNFPSGALSYEPPSLPLSATGSLLSLEEAARERRRDGDDGGGGGGVGGGSRLFATSLTGSVFLSVSVSLPPLDEAVIQPIREAPQVANRAESGTSFGRRWRTCCTCTAKEKERRHTNVHRNESKSKDGMDAIQVGAPRCAIRAEHLHLHLSDDLIKPRRARLLRFWGLCTPTT